MKRAAGIHTYIQLRKLVVHVNFPPLRAKETVSSLTKPLSLNPIRRRCVLLSAFPAHLLRAAACLSGLIFKEASHPRPTPSCFMAFNAA